MLTLKVWSLWKSSTALRIVHLIDICKTRGKGVDHVADFGPQIYPQYSSYMCLTPHLSPPLNYMNIDMRIPKSDYVGPILENNDE